MRRMVAAGVAATFVAAAPAAGHVQVRPSVAAPDDPVLWTVLVPSEDDAGTRQVELAIPKDVLPFSFEDEPGWSRRQTMNQDGSIRSVVWRGRTKGDGLATFRFLASTPQSEGTIRWAALQTYNDGKIVRWIGQPDSDNPAATTRIRRSVPRENAGGEGAGGAASGAAEAAVAPAPAPVAAEGSSTDWLARGLGLAGLLATLGVLAGEVHMRRGRDAER